MRNVLNPKSRAADQKRAVLANVITEFLQLLSCECLGCNIDEISFCRVPVYPVFRVAGSIRKALKLAHSFGKHRSVVLLADDPIGELVLLQKRRCESVIAEPTAAFPPDRFGDSTFVRAFDHLFKSWDYMRVAVFTAVRSLSIAYPFVSNSSGRT